MTFVVEPLADLIRRHHLFEDHAESLARQVEDWANDPIGELRSLEDLATALLGG